MSLDHNQIKELANLVAVAFEVFLSVVDGLLLAKTAADVGRKMANARVEKCQGELWVFCHVPRFAGIYCIICWRHPLSQAKS